ncbi:insulinase family protein [Psychrosphaera sp. G1-22]|uniref:Insulinase family protein n=1 Tax=Psychrosphaera algicola TaxID=3023714 RepID=A0ABT5FI64_9GAMM|nr:insulinase family protein [Psychrosphaera sp. G1-22]MDC2890886.1 insulinase family protein [Psychrosphaera sp. G1-22]
MNISPNDNKNYLAMTLDNGLRIVLVEQDDCHKNACSLVVNTGHFDDPVDRPGFAHFVEHLLFNGSKNTQK